MKKRPARPAPTRPPTGPAPKPPPGGKPQWLEHLSVLRLEPGDRLVLQVQHDPTMEEMAWYREYMEEAFPGVPCVVVANGATLGVVREAEAP